MAGRAGNIAPESRMQGVILSETARRPSCGRRRLFRGKADRRNRCGTTRQAAPADTQAGIPRIQKPWSGPNGSGKRSGATAGDKQPAARNRQWTTTNKRRAMNDGRRKGRCKGRCNEDRQDCGVRRQKNRPAQPQARRHGPKAGIQYLFLLAQNTHRNVENRRIVQRNHASVRPRLEMDTHAFFRLVFPSEIVADGVYIDS